MVKVKSLSDIKQWIECLRFCKCGSGLCLGCKVAHHNTSPSACIIQAIVHKMSIRTLAAVPFWKCRLCLSYLLVKEKKIHQRLGGIGRGSQVHGLPEPTKWAQVQHGQLSKTLCQNSSIAEYMPSIRQIYSVLTKTYRERASEKQREKERRRRKREEEREGKSKL